MYYNNIVIDSLKAHHIPPSGALSTNDTTNPINPLSGQKPIWTPGIDKGLSRNILRVNTIGLEKTASFKSYNGKPLRPSGSICINQNNQKLKISINSTVPFIQLENKDKQCVYCLENKPIIKKRLNIVGDVHEQLEYWDTYTNIPEYIENQIMLLKILLYLLVDENTYIKSQDICDYYYEFTGILYKQHFSNNDVQRVLNYVDGITYNNKDDSWNISNYHLYNKHILFMGTVQYINELNNSI